MGKSKQIFQKLNTIFFLLLALLAGVALVQGFLSNIKEPKIFFGAFLAPWILFLGFFIGDLLLVCKKPRCFLEKREKVRRVLQGVAIVVAILSVLGLGLFFAEKINFGEEGQMLLALGEHIGNGNLTGANAEMIDYLSGKPGYIIYGSMLCGITWVVSDTLWAIFILQMILLTFVLIIVYFLVRKISGRTGALASVCLVGGALIWKKVVYEANTHLLYLLLVLLSLFFLSLIFAGQNKEKRFSSKDLAFLTFSGIFLALATMFKLETIVLMLPCLFYIGFSKRNKEETGESILESRGIRCLIFFFVYGIAAVSICLILALMMQHTLRITFPFDGIYWNTWLNSPLDGILGFFYKLESIFLGRSYGLYGYGLALGLLSLAFVQGIVLLFRKNGRFFLPVYVVNGLLIIELILEKQPETGITLLVLTAVLGSELFGSVYDALLAKQLEREKLDERYENAMAVSQVASNGQIEIKDIVEERIAAEEAAVVNREPETEPEVEEEPEVAATVEIEEEEPEIIEPVKEERKEPEDSAEILELKEKLKNMEALMESQQMRIVRMEEMMKEQQLLAKKRERRLRQELAIARNRRINSNDKIKR